jgi:hypothetical protein
MKIQIMFVSVTVACSLLFSACSTTSISSVITPNTVEVATQVSSFAGATLAMQKDTNAKAYLQLAQSVLDTALNNGVNVTNLESALSSVSTKALNNPSIVQFLPAGLQLLEAVEGQNMVNGIAGNAYVLASVTGLDNGIRLSLGESVIPLPTVIPPTTNSIPVPVLTVSTNL